MKYFRIEKHRNFGRMDPGQPPSTTEPGISHQNRKEDSNIAVELANTGPEPLDDLSDAAAITRDPDAEIENEVPQSTEALAGKSMPVASNEEDKNHMTAPAAPSDGAIKEELLKYLKEDTFTMDVTERQLRTRLEAHFGMPLKDKKTVIRDQVRTCFLSSSYHHPAQLDIPKLKSRKNLVCCPLCACCILASFSMQSCALFSPGSPWEASNNLL